MHLGNGVEVASCLETSTLKIAAWCETGQEKEATSSRSWFFQGVLHRDLEWPHFSLDQGVPPAAAKPTRPFPFLRGFACPGDLQEGWVAFWAIIHSITSSSKERSGRSCTEALDPARRPSETAQQPSTRHPPAAATRIGGPGGLAIFVIAVQSAGREAGHGRAQPPTRPPP